MAFSPVEAVLSVSQRPIRDLLILTVGSVRSGRRVAAQARVVDARPQAWVPAADQAGTAASRTTRSTELISRTAGTMSRPRSSR